MSRGWRSPSLPPQVPTGRRLAGRKSDSLLGELFEHDPRTSDHETAVSSLPRAVGRCEDAGRERRPARWLFPQRHPRPGRHRQTDDARRARLVRTAFGPGRHGAVVCVQRGPKRDGGGLCRVDRPDLCWTQSGAQRLHPLGRRRDPRPGRRGRRRRCAHRAGRRPGQDARRIFAVGRWRRPNSATPRMWPRGPG